MRVVVRRSVPQEPNTLRGFAEKYDLALEIVERPGWTGKSPWEAYFADVGVSEDGYVDYGLRGWGQTPEDAVTHYCELVSDRQMLIKAPGFLGALGSGVKEVRCPLNWADTSFDMPNDDMGVPAPVDSAAPSV